MGRRSGDNGGAPSAGPDPAARDALVLDHLHLVRAVARHLRLDVARWPAAPVDRDDYLAAGAEALVRAGGTWRPDRGCPFGITQPAVSQRLRLARRELTRVLAAEGAV